VSTSMRRQGLGGFISAAAVIAGLVSAGVAQAGTISVTTTGDPGTAGTISLRQALAAAGDGDTVSVPAGHYTLAAGQLVITKAITVMGGGPSVTVVDANGASRVFDVTSTGSVTFQALTITGGRVDVGSTSLDGGAGVFDNSGSLAFSNVELTANAVTGGGGKATIQGGGAIFSGGGALTVANSTLTANSVTLSGSASNNGGGAIYNNGGGVTVTNSALSTDSVALSGLGTTSNDGGGAIYDNGSGVTVTGGLLTGNSASISGGTSNNGGGAVYENGGGPAFSASSISNNTLTISGGTTNDGGGGIYNNGGNFTLTASTVAANNAKLTGTEGFNGGGGIYNNGGAPTFVNVTVSDNALAAPGATNVGGGGLYQNGTPGTVTNATLTANQSNQPGGAIFGDAGLTLKSTIVAANSASSGNANCDGPTASTSAGNNLEDTSPTTCHLTATGDLVGVPAGLGRLADNGGPAPTHALPAGSPAVDHIPLAQCTDQQGTPQPVMIDERGVPRGLDGACDIGAYELAPAELAVTASASPSSMPLGGQSTLTFPVSNAGPAPATNTTVNVAIPAGLTLLSASTSQGSCSAGSSGMSCSIGLVRVGASAHVTAVVRGAAVGTQTVTGAVGATEPDPTPADNTAAVAIAVTAPPPVAPVLSRLLLSPETFRAAPSGPSALAAATKKRKPKPGTLISYNDSQAAVTTFTVLQSRNGIRKGKRCVISTRKPKATHNRPKRCKLLVSVGSFTHTDRAGRNRLRFTGRLRRHKLKPGSYQLRAIARNGTGQTSRPITKHLRIKG
jgi:uncharacterized repeat protein (TIGR01451 family)